MDLFRSHPRSIKTFARNADGSISVEFILWVPIIFFFWFLAIQVSLLFVVQSSFWNAAAETARLVSRHAIDTQTAESYAANTASVFGISPNASVSVVNDIVNVTISIPALHVTALNPLGFQSDYNIAASINYTIEPL